MASDAVVYQDLGLYRLDPFWGFSNHASSWRRAVWQEFPFDEAIVAAEDKEWALRVMHAGWTIAMDRRLDVAAEHRFDEGIRSFNQRMLRDFRRRVELLSAAPNGAPGWRLRCSPWRTTAFLARYRVSRATSSRNAS